MKDFAIYHKLIYLIAINLMHLIYAENLPETNRNYVIQHLLFVCRNYSLKVKDPFLPKN